MTDLYTNKLNISSKKSDFSQTNHAIWGYKTPMVKQIIFCLTIDYQVFMLKFLLNIRLR